MNGFIDHDSEDISQYVEVDPTGRYGRYNEILGKGSSKIVYRAFDEYDGIEVAWNQVKLTDFLQRPEDLERLYSEIHLLKTLKHKNIMKFYTSWVDTNNRNINFVTEMFTSGTLRQYRLKHKKVNIRAVKQWCRQILEGLLYLHSHDPPVIHRDLKCDNIFINGNQGEVKIGDLGLAAILRKSHAARCVGTPEFMAPEVYAEEYNELVDIYSFGMCVLEMVTFEYPYSECTHPAQIYKKVVSGKKPDALYKVKDPEIRGFVDKCLATVSNRLSAKELLEDPFLLSNDKGKDLRSISHDKDGDKIGPLVVEVPFRDPNAWMNCTDYDGYEPDHDYESQTLELAASEIGLFSSQDDDSSDNDDITIQGRRKASGDIFLRLRMTDKEGRIRNIYFPFDIESDTAMTVATEMVSELEINDQDVTRIADMIDGEIALLVPDWKTGLSIEDSDVVSSVLDLKKELDAEEDSEVPDYGPKTTLADFISFGSPGPRRIQMLRCASHGSTSMRGRFEEITYQGDGSGEVSFPAIGIQHDRRPSWNFHGSTRFDLDEAGDKHDESGWESESRKMKMPFDRDTRTPYNSPSGSVLDDNEYQSEVKNDLSLLKARYEMQVKEMKDRQLITPKEKPPLLLPVRKDHSELKRDKKLPKRSTGKGLNENDLKYALRKHFSPHFPWDFGQKKRSGLPTRKLQSESCSPENPVIGESSYRGPAYPHSLQRTTSLPVDAAESTAMYIQARNEILL
ncbi:hypothetical protein KSS87_015387 [Heliosperma pusillum]|nr:hypothetical protein KSS87_015387 [Heliosperma pusillum]